MQTTVIYNVYVFDDSDNIFDNWGEFDTLAEAREYIKYLMVEDMNQLLNYKCAIYVNIETYIE